MPKDAYKNIGRYQMAGGDINPEEYRENQEALADQPSSDEAQLIPGTPPEQNAAQEVEESAAVIPSETAAPSRRAPRKRSTKKAAKKTSKKAAKKAAKKRPVAKKSTRKAAKKTARIGLKRLVASKASTKKAAKKGGATKKRAAKKSSGSKKRTGGKSRKTARKR
ncbi:MAG TPA: hypothetical protein VGP85_13710 [Pyrinomonadaceae bacterium]|jgi:membrane protein involved in colicin uptake|nr:hypothetical protein [Pyrinomonadaceae bacterium]